MLVIGMHRSGTSAVTQALAALGLDPGREPQTEVTDDNPTGLYEVARLTGLDDEVLDALGGRWAAPPDADPAAVAALARTPLGDEARSLCAEFFTGPGWVWKDPRVALILPFWREVLRPEPATVVVLRQPVEVARSLQTRDGIALDYGLALWERYTRTMLRDLEGLAAFVVDYETVIDEPIEIMGALVTFLTDAGLALPDADPERGAEAVTADHRRQRVTSRDVSQEPAFTDQMRALHDVAEGLVGAHRSFPAVDLGSETPRLQVAFDEHKRLSRFEEQAHALDLDLGTKDRQIGDLLEEIDRRSGQASELATQVMALQDERDSLSDRLVDLESWWPVLTALRARRVLRGITRRDPDTAT